MHCQNVLYLNSTSTRERSFDKSIEGMLQTTVGGTNLDSTSTKVKCFNRSV